MQRTKQPSSVLAVIVFVALSALGAVVAITPGCGAFQDPDQLFVATVDTFVNKSVGPEYVAYVDGDPELTEMQKQSRFDNVELLRRAVEVMKTTPKSSPDIPR